MDLVETYTDAQIADAWHSAHCGVEACAEDHVLAQLADGGHLRRFLEGLDAP
jgi:hypothetical protein